MTKRYYEGSPKRMALTYVQRMSYTYRWGVMLVAAFTGFFYVKSANRMRKKQYIAVQAQTDEGGTCVCVDSLMNRAQAYLERVSWVVGIQPTR